MKLKYIFPVGLAISKAKLFGIRTPLAVCWVLGTRCNLQCIYCRSWQKNEPEFNTSEVISRLEDFRRLGTKFLSLTGGEPLLRDDIGAIIESAKSKGFYVRLSSNGKLVEEKIDQIKSLDAIKLSLDGSPKVHDFQRGKGSYDSVMRAIESCKKYNIKISLQCVLTKFNLDDLDFLLDLGTRTGAKIFFQPAVEKMLYSSDPNPCIPSVEEYKKVINKLIERKKKCTAIGNSLEGLKYLYYWPEPRKIQCSAGMLAYEVQPDGSLSTCGRMGEGTCKVNNGLSDALKNVPTFPDCNSCYCAHQLDFNLVVSLNIRTVLEYLNTYWA